MYNTFEEAKAAAIKTIQKYGYTDSCVVTESKRSRNAKKTVFGFRFNDFDTDGKFVELSDGTYCKATLI